MLRSEISQEHVDELKKVVGEVQTYAAERAIWFVENVIGNDLKSKPEILAAKVGLIYTSIILDQAAEEVQKAVSMNI